MPVTVSPIKTINVRVNSQNQQLVRSTSQFVGSSSTTAQEAIILATQAELIANTAYALAANSLPLTGGTITGELDVTGNVVTYSDFVGIIDAGSF